jgi:hypothetical protein
MTVDLRRAMLEIRHYLRDPVDATWAADQLRAHQPVFVLHDAFLAAQVQWLSPDDPADGHIRGSSGPQDQRMRAIATT